jgi:hypothetical protein
VVALALDADVGRAGVEEELGVRRRVGAAHDDELRELLARHLAQLAAAPRVGGERRDADELGPFHAAADLVHLGDRVVEQLDLVPELLELGRQDADPERRVDLVARELALRDVLVGEDLGSFLADDLRLGVDQDDFHVANPGGS